MVELQVDLQKNLDVVLRFREQFGSPLRIDLQAGEKIKSIYLLPVLRYEPKPGTTFNAF